MDRAFPNLWVSVVLITAAATLAFLMLVNAILNSAWWSFIPFVFFVATGTYIWVHARDLRQRKARRT